PMNTLVPTPALSLPPVGAGRRGSVHQCVLSVVILLLATASSLGQSQTVLFNEVQLSNGITLADENGDYPDWVELFNPGPDAINLNGWGLSDSTNALFKWTFTNATLAAGDFMLVFASGKDRQSRSYDAVDPATVPGLRVWLRA